MNYYLLGLIGFLMGLAIQRFIKAIMIKDDAGRDHCEILFAILVVALTDALTKGDVMNPPFILNNLEADAALCGTLFVVGLYGIAILYYVLFVDKTFRK